MFYRTVPRAILIAVPVIISVYLLANLSYFSAMNPQQLLSTPVVAVVSPFEVSLLLESIA